MRFSVNTVNFHTAGLEAREAVAFEPAQQRTLLEALKSADSSIEAVVLCTCNRTEIYLNCPKKVSTESLLAKVLSQVSPVGAAAWKAHHQTFIGREAVEHLFSVAAGLDSQMLGENQIVRQLKDAYTQSIECGTSRFFFHKLMHCAFRASKAVRQGTQINCGAVSLGMAAIEAVRLKMPLQGSRVLLVGAGENAALVARYLYKDKIKSLTIVNRTLESANELASQFKDAQAAALACMPQLLSDADLAIFSTASPHPVLTAEDAGYYLSQRTKPLLIVDLAVPRDVEPQVGHLANVELINIEQLQVQVQANLARREVWIKPAQKIIAQHIQRFTKWQDSLDTAAVITELTQAILTEAAEHAKRYRRYFSKQDQARLEAFADSLAAKFLHYPISYLKQAGSGRRESDKAQAADVINKLFLQRRRRRAKK